MDANKIVHYPYQIQSFLKSFCFFSVSISFSTEIRTHPTQSGIEPFHMIRMDVGILNILNCIRVFRLRSLIFFSFAPRFLFFATLRSLRLSIFYPYFDSFLQGFTRAPPLPRFQKFITKFKQYIRPWITAPFGRG